VAKLRQFIVIDFYETLVKIPPMYPLCKVLFGRRFEDPGQAKKYYAAG